MEKKWYQLQYTSTYTCVISYLYYYIINAYIFYFSVPLDGKNKAVDVKSVPPLVRLLKDKEPDVRANAAGALMM